MEFNIKGIGSGQPVLIGYNDLMIDDNMFYFGYIDPKLDIVTGEGSVTLDVISMPSPMFEGTRQERTLCFGNIVTAVGFMQYMPVQLRKFAMMPIPGRLLNLVKQHNGFMEKASAQYLQEQEMMNDETDKTLN